MLTGRGISDQGNELEVTATEEDSIFEDEFANALLDDGDGGGKAPESDKSGEEEEEETKDKEKDSGEEKPKKKEKEIEKDETPEGEEDDPLKEIDDDETNEQRWKSLQGIYKRDKEKWNKEKEQLLTEIEKVKKTVTEKDSEKEGEDTEEESITLKDFRESLTTEQKEELDQYEKDFDVVTRMEGLKRDMMLSQLKAELKSFMDEVKSQLEPTRKTVEELRKEGEVRSMEEHFGKIGDAHSDYTEHRDSGALEVWVKTKPAYLQRGLMEVLNEGTAEEIIELLDDFKVENNIKKKVDPEKAAELDSRREKKRKAITTVNTKHGAVDVSAGSSEDFEGAFEEAMRQ